MKKNLYLVSILTLLSFSFLDAQTVIYLHQNPTADWEHDQPKGQVVNCYLDKAIQIRPFCPEWDEKTDKVIYTMVSRNEALEVKPHPDKPGWWVLQALKPVEKVHVDVLVTADSAITYKVPVEKGSNRIALPDENGKFNRSKVEWSPHTIGKEPILFETFLFKVI